MSRRPSLKNAIRLLNCFLLAFGVALPGWAQAAEFEAEPRGFELPGQTERQDLDQLPASTGELVYFVGTSGATLGSKVTGAWIAEDVGAAAPPNTVIDQGVDIEMKGESMELRFSLSRPNNGWPPGKYRLEVRQGENVIFTKKFEILAAQ